MHTHNNLHRPAMVIKALCILVTFTLLTGFVQIIIVEMYKEFSRHPVINKPIITLTGPEKKQQEINEARKEFTPDGTLYLVNYNPISPPPHQQDEKYIDVKDRDNNILFSGEEKKNPYSFIQWESRTRDPYSYGILQQEKMMQLNTLEAGFTRCYVVPMVNSENRRIGHWFWNSEKRYFKYYSISGQCGGYLGANGYTNELRLVEPFDKFITIENWLSSNSYNPKLLYRTELSLYQIDFQNKQVQSLIKTTKDPIIYVNMNNWKEAKPSQYRPMLTVITESNRLFLFLQHPDQRIETQLPDGFFFFNTPDIAAAGDKIWALTREPTGAPKTNDRDEFVSWIKATQDQPRDFKVTLFEIDKNGNFLEKSSFAWTQPRFYLQSTDENRAEAFNRIISSFSSPLPRLIIDQLQKIENYTYHAKPVYIQIILEFFYITSRFSWSINLGILTIFAALTLLHGRPRRTSVIKLAFWIAFVALFNLAGFLTYLALNHTPVVKCASCGKRRGLEIDACCRCGAVLPSPKSKETDLITTLSA